MLWTFHPTFKRFMRKTLMWWFDCVISACTLTIDDLIHPIKYHSNMIVNVEFIYSKSWDNTILLSVPHDLKAYMHDLLLYHFYIMYFSNKNHRWVALKMLISAMYFNNIGLTSDLNGGGVSSLHLKLLNIKIYI